MGDSRLPLVSIVTPSYNQGQFIEDNILSVKNQDYPNIEHIIIDGGSTDSTLDVLKKYEGTYNMQWVSEPDEGQSDAINKGVNRASGSIIAWLNSDDVYFQKQTISKVVSAFQKSDVDVVFGDMAYIDRTNNILRVYAQRNFDLQKLLRGKYDLGQPAAFFRFEVLSKNPLKKNLNYVMDFELWCRLACGFYTFRYLSEALAALRLYEGTKSSKQNIEKLLQEKREVILKYTIKSGISFKRKRILIILDKLTGASYGRLGGLLKLIRYQYFGVDLGFNGRWLPFPSNFIKQIFYTSQARLFK